MMVSTSYNVECPVVLTAAVSVAMIRLFHVPPKIYAEMGELGTEIVARPVTKTTNLVLVRSAVRNEALGYPGHLDDKTFEAYCTAGAL